MSLERKITRIKNFPLIKRKKVAICCRVSTTHKDQLHSLANQISYFRDLVDSHLDWELVGIYPDVRSGKNTSGRREFQRMLEDCRNHKIEMIITKSINRFGRNTVATIDAINQLRALLVDVYFENDNIHTKGSQNDFIISILEAYAQAESQARSENIKWGIAKGFKDGS